MKREGGTDILVTAGQITAHYGTALASLPEPDRQRYEDYASQANAYVEAHVYRYIDALPMSGTVRVFAARLAWWYALWCKAIDDGASNAESMQTAWTKMEADLVKVLQARPELVNTRRVVSAGYRDEVTPYSQSYGVSDIL